MKKNIKNKIKITHDHTPFKICLVGLLYVFINTYLYNINMRYVIYTFNKLIFTNG